MKTRTRPKSSTSPNRLQNLNLQQVQEIIYAVSLKGDPLQSSVKFLSNGIESTLGYKPKEFLDNPQLWISCIHPDDTAGVKRLTSEMIQGGKPIVRTYRFRHKLTRGYVWIEDKPTLQLDGKGRVTGYVGVAHDITESKRVEESLRTGSERHRTLVANLPVVFFAIDQDGVFQLSEGKGLNALGLKPGQVVGQSVYKLYGDVPSILEDIRRALRGEEFSSSVEVAGLIFETSYTPVRNEFGIITGLIGVSVDVTKRTKSEQALHESDERFRRLAEATFDGIAIHEKGTILEVNPAFYRLFGYNSEELLGKSILRLTAPESRDAVVHNIQSGYERPYEAVGLRKDGSKFHGELLGKSILYEGRAARITAIRDISERKQAEVALRESEERYRALHDYLPFMYFTVKPDGTVISVNRFGKEHLGYSTEELVGHSVLGVFVESDKAAAAAHVQECLANPGKVFEWELRKKRKNGTELWVKETAHAILDQKGEWVVLIGCQDVTERKRTENELHRQTEYFRQLFEDAPAGIVVLDTENRILMANQSFKRIFQYSSEELVGREIDTMVVPTDLKPEGRGLSDSSQHGSLVHAESKRRRKDGTLVDVVITGYPIVIDGKQVGIYGMYEDNTERQQLQDRLRQNQRLESIGTLASGVAHDFNNILAIVLGHTTLLERFRSDPQKFQESVSTISKVIQRGASLVRQLLTFARKTEVVFESVRVNDIILEVEKLLRETFPKTITISMDLHKALPSIKADATQVHQVLLNLCVNARDAMPKGGTVYISTKALSGEILSPKHPAVRQKDYVEIQIRDTGAGINERTLQRIFEPFFTTKGPGQGTGLGLALVYGIVDAHGGFIDVSSEMDKGTTFFIYLPTQEPHPNVSTISKNISQDAPGGTETILVIEDEEMLRDFVKAILVPKGYNVLTAEDGEKGVEMFSLRHEEISAVITDIGLPKLGGEEVFRRIRAIQPKAKVLLASGFVEPAVKSGMLKAGAKRFLQKPYWPDDVLKALRDVIDMKD